MKPNRSSLLTRPFSVFVLLVGCGPSHEPETPGSKQESVVPGLPKPPAIWNFVSWVDKWFRNLKPNRDRGEAPGTPPRPCECDTLTVRPEQLNLEPGESSPLTVLCDASDVTRSTHENVLRGVVRGALMGASARVTQYESLDPKVAVVDDQGHITALSEGTTEIGVQSVNATIARFHPQVCGAVGRMTVTVACPKGLTECDGRCVDLESDPAHCAGCGYSCEPEASCVEGDCMAPEADLRVEDAWPPPAPNEEPRVEVPFEVRLFNSGSGHADWAYVSLFFTGPLERAAASYRIDVPGQMGAWVGDCVSINMEISCDLARLPAGATVSIVGMMSSSAPGLVLFDAKATASTPDPDPSNNQASAGYNFVCPPPRPYWNVETRQCEPCPRGGRWNGESCGADVQFVVRTEYNVPGNAPSVRTTEPNLSVGTPGFGFNLASEITMDSVKTTLGTEATGSGASLSVATSIDVYVSGAPGTPYAIEARWNGEAFAEALNANALMCGAGAFYAPYSLNAEAFAGQQTTDRETAQASDRGQTTNRSIEVEGQQYTLAKTYTLGQNGSSCTCCGPGGAAYSKAELTARVLPP